MVAISELIVAQSSANYTMSLSLNADYQNAMILKTSPFFISPLLYFDAIIFFALSTWQSIVAGIPTKLGDAEDRYP